MLQVLYINLHSRICLGNVYIHVHEPVLPPFAVLTLNWSGRQHDTRNLQGRRSTALISYQLQSAIPSGPTCVNSMTIDMQEVQCEIDRALPHEAPSDWTFKACFQTRNATRTIF